MTAEQLKASILQMAIEGKLVPQLDDEPAVDIEAVEPEEVPFAIPEKWKWVHLKDIANINGGFAFKSTEYTKNGIRVVRISDFNEYGFINNKIVRYPFSNSLSQFLLEEKNILLCMTGGTVGKSLFVENLEEQMVVNQRVATIKPSKVMPEYVYVVIRAPLTQNIIQQSKNSTNDNISMETIKHFLIPLPPAKEQKRILTRLNEILPLIEEYGKAHSALKNVEQALPDQLRASLLQEAIEGKLVPQLDDEPAVDMAGEEPDEVPFAIPEKWRWMKLGDCAEINPKVSADDDSDVSFVPMPLLQAGYGNSIDTSNKRKWKEMKKGFTKFCDGDVVLAKITPCFENRKSAIVSNAINGIGAGTTELHVFRCKNSLLPEFLLMFFKSAYLIQYGVDHFKGTAGQQRIGTTDLKICPIPLPPLAEQRRIVARLEELLPHVDAIAGLR
ncbi:MAG: restriction endonuclease subunit S [Desulfovibrionaceae bacterium]|nr:restriction endonuclease subunit S [Desulfovibrionaceae bacterium]